MNIRRIAGLASAVLTLHFAAPASAGLVGPGIDESRFIEAGGMEHWVTINGADRGNPVLFIVHGGPGNPLTVLADFLYPDWEKDFTIVHYDQRGAGRTYARNMPVEELSMAILERYDLDLEMLVRDGVELARYVCDYLGADTLILSGTSWGAALAVEIYQREPNLFSAYVGLSQMVNFQTTLAASYRKVEAIARVQGDETALEKLAEIGPPPWTNPRFPGQLRRLVRQYENATTTTLGALEWSDEYATPEARAAYFAGEEFSWVKFVGLNGDGFANQVNLMESGREFDCPVVLIQGEGDLLTTTELSRAYFDSICAPRKDFILVPDAGHDPNRSMLATQFRVLKSLVK